MRRTKRVVASRGRAFAYAILRAHKCSLFFGDFHHRSRGVSRYFFTAAGRRNGIKHRFSAHIAKKAAHRRVFHRGSVQDCGKVVHKRLCFPDVDHNLHTSSGNSSCILARIVQVRRPGEASSSPTVATRVQTPCAPLSTFACRLAMAAPVAPRTARSPTPFRAP